MNDLVDRIHEQLVGDDKNGHRNDHGGDVLDAGVTEGMVAVSRLCRDAEADQRHDLGEGRLLEDGLVCQNYQHGEQGDLLPFP